MALFNLIKRLKSIHKISSSQRYIDDIMSKTVKETSLSKIDVTFGKLAKIKALESSKVKSAYTSTIVLLKKLAKEFEDITGLPKIYKELITLDHIDYTELKKNIGLLYQITESLSKNLDIALMKIKRANNIEFVYKIKKSAVGYLTNRLDRMNKQFAYFEEARKVLKNLPFFKEDVMTIAISGFPNVGKSTLLNKLTTAKPEIASYEFTTKGLNLGYATHNMIEFQFIDTPGTLNRAEGMNNIEKKAELIMKELADIIILVIDAPLNYSIEKHTKLLEHLKALNKPILVYISMSDLAQPDEVISNISKYSIYYTYEFDKLLDEIYKTARKMEFNHKYSKI